MLDRGQAYRVSANSSRPINMRRISLVPELYRRLVAGHSLHSIARDFQARGIRTRSGLIWSPQHLRSVALSPTYTGLRAHRPGSAGSRGQRAPVAVSEMYEGQWPA